MKKVFTAVIAGIVGFAAMNGAASAQYQPEYCPDRNNAAYSDDTRNGRYYSSRYDGDRRSARNVRGYDAYNNGYRARGNRVLSRKVLDTRFRARIVVKEEVAYTRRGKRLFCTITTRGPEAGYIPRKRLKRVAYNHCSPRARVRYYT